MGSGYGGDTEQGRQAYEILDWVYSSPAANITEGRARVTELARNAASPQALNEIQDVGTMLSRLTGSLGPGGVRNISSQVV